MGNETEPTVAKKRNVKPSPLTKIRKNFNQAEQLIANHDDTVAGSKESRENYKRIIGQISAARDGLDLYVPRGRQTDDTKADHDFIKASLTAIIDALEEDADNLAL